MLFTGNTVSMERAVATFGNKLVGDSQPCYVIAEIGINHNGDVDLAKRLISVAIAAGCDAVKFQKRTIDVVYSAEELARPRESPFGSTNGDLKHGLELDFYDYQEDRKSTRLNSSHVEISYAVFCLKKKNTRQ